MELLYKHIDDINFCLCYCTYIPCKLIINDNVWLYMTMIIFFDEWLLRCSKLNVSFHNCPSACTKSGGLHGFECACWFRLSLTFVALCRPCLVYIYVTPVLISVSPCIVSTHQCKMKCTNSSRIPSVTKILMHVISKFLIDNGLAKYRHELATYT